MYGNLKYTANGNLCLERQESQVGQESELASIASQLRSLLTGAPCALSHSRQGKFQTENKRRVILALNLGHLDLYHVVTTLFSWTIHQRRQT